MPKVQPGIALALTTDGQSTITADYGINPDGTAAVASWRFRDVEQADMHLTAAGADSPLRRLKASDAAALHDQIADARRARRAEQKNR